MDYYVPLPKLLPNLPADLLHKLGPTAEHLAARVGVRRIREVWNDTHAVFTGEIVLTGEIDLGPFVLGTPGDGTTEFAFELVTDRMSLLHHALAAGEGTFTPDTVPPTSDAKVKAILAADGPPLTFRLRLHLPQLRFRPDKDKFVLGDLVHDPATGNVIGITEKPGNLPLDLLVADISVVLDSANYFIPDWDDVDVEILPTLPPFVWRQGEGRSFGFEGSEIRLDLSRKEGIAQVLGRPGYTEEWLGLYVGRLRMFGLDQVWHFFPPVVELTEWILGFNDLGWSGRADFVFPRPAGDKTTARLERLSLEIDRGHFVRLGGEMSIYLTHDDADPDDDVVLLIGLTFRDAPDGGWSGEATLRVPAGSEDALFFFPVNYLPLVFTGTADVVAATAYSPGALLAVGLLGIGGWLQFGGQLALTELALTRFTTRFFTKDVNGHRIRFLDFVIDIRARVQLDMPPILILPRLKTAQGEPLGIELRELTFRLALNSGDVLELAGAKRFDFDWPANSVTFSNTEQLAIGDFVLAKVGFGRWDQGLWIDLGIKLREGRGGSGMSAFVARLFFSEADGWALDHASIENSGWTFSLLLPDVLYVHGALQWLDGLQGSLRAFIVGNGTGAPDRYKERSAWLWEISVTLAERRAVDPTTGESFWMLVVTGDFENATGFPIPFTSASAYGLSAQYVKNARPAFDAAHSNPPDYGWWFMDLEPRYRLDASKWTPARDADGFGFGLAIGSSWDGGRSWKIKGGALVQSGPVVIVHARGDVFGEPPSFGEPPGSHDGFAAAVVWDGIEEQLSIDLRYERHVPASGKILQLSAPLKIFADFNESSNSYVHIGQHWPIERRVLVRLLKTLDISFYIMVDGRGIQDLAGHSEIDVPGTAIALGVGGRWEKGLKKGPLRCSFRLVVDANFVFSLGDIELIAGAFVIDGGLALKVYGLGFELHVYADLAWLLGRVWGKIGVRVGLPWPLPDIKAEVPIGIGDQSALPEPSAFTQALVMSRPGERATTPVAAGVLAPNAPAVPIDAWLSLSFAYPTRSGASTSSFVLSDSDVTTAHVAAAEHEYVFDLTDLVLWMGEAGTGTALHGPYAGVWKAEPVKASGGKAASRVLHLLTWDQIDARHVGPSAEYLDGALDAYDPCAKPPPVREVCFDVHAEPLGPIVPGRTLTAPTDPSNRRLEVESRSPLFSAESVLRRGTVFAQPAEVVPCPIPVTGVKNPRAILLPTLLRGGGGIADDPALPHAADTLVLRYTLAASATLEIIAAPGQGLVTVRFFRGDQLVHQDSGTPFGPLVSGFQRRLHQVKAASTRIEITAQQIKAGPRETRLPHLLSTCFIFQADLDASAQQEATHDAWSSFWSDLLSAGAATGGQLLEPATRYTLEATVRWRHRDPTTGDETTPSAPKVARFPFVTEGAEAALARRLRPRTRDFAAAGDNWDVETVPADGEEAIYTERPLHLTFRDGRFDAYYARFGRRVVLRLVDEQGQDLFDRLEFLATHATELPEYQQTWYEFVTEGCAEGASVLWHVGVARFTTVLETNQRYEAALIPVVEPFDPGTVDWNAYTPLHTFRFRTSRWPNLTAHLAAHAVLDEVATTSDLAALFTALGSPAPGRRLDDQALDEILATLGLPPRPPATAPEVVRVWRATENGYEVVALLVDGPEPLVRDAASVLALRKAASVAVPAFVLGGSSGARLLILFREGAGFSALSAATVSALHLDVTHPFAGLDGLPAAEGATLAIPIPARPPFFDEEAP